MSRWAADPHLLRTREHQGTQVPLLKRITGARPVTPASSNAQSYDRCRNRPGYAGSGLNQLGPVLTR
jgi:hypothetical protein